MMYVVSVSMAGKQTQHLATREQIEQTQPAMLAPGYLPVASLEDSWVMIRPALDRDWVNGEFVGDHEEPTTGTHLHGAP